MNGLSWNKGYRDIEKENEFKMRKYFPLEIAILQVQEKKKERKWKSFFSLSFIHGVEKIKLSEHNKSFIQKFS